MCNYSLILDRERYSGSNSLEECTICFDQTFVSQFFQCTYQDCSISRKLWDILRLVAIVLNLRTLICNSLLSELSLIHIQMCIRDRHYRHYGFKCFQARNKGVYSCHSCGLQCLLFGAVGEFARSKYSLRDVWPSERLEVRVQYRSYIRYQSIIHWIQKFRECSFWDIVDFHSQLFSYFFSITDFQIQ